VSSGRATRRLAVVLAVVSALAFVAPSAQAQGKVDKITFTVTLTSQQTVLEQVGRGGTKTYGWNQLTGTASTGSGDVGVTLLGNVSYVDGSGPFYGFLTLEFASLSTLGLTLNGKAAKQADGSTKLTSKLQVIDGNAAFTGATGSGSFTGSRAAALGSPIVIKVTVNVRGVST
jgi:hypothetical protein